MIYPRAASRMRKGSVRERAFALPLLTRNGRPKFPLPGLSWIVARPHTRAALSAVHRARYVSGKRQGGGLFDARIYPRRAYFRPAFPFRIFVNICANVRRVLSLSFSIYLSICLSVFRLSVRLFERDEGLRYDFLTKDDGAGISILR